MRSTRSLRFLLTALAVGCGDSTGIEEPDYGPCGPNGTLHQGPGAPAHCHCDDGFTEVDGRCVPDVASAPDAGTRPDAGGLGAPDCGPNGVLDGRFCRCDRGYTQVGSGTAIRCEAIPTCRAPDDPNEPNDAPAQATRLPGAGAFTAHACPGNPDWYVFPVAAGDTVSVVLEFDARTVDLDLFLFGPASRDPLDFSTGTTSREQARFTTAVAGTAGVFVNPYGIGEGDYRLSIDVRAGEVPECIGAYGACRVDADCCSRDCHVGHCH